MLSTIGVAALSTVPTVAGIGTYSWMRSRGMSGIASILGAGAAVAAGNLAAVTGIAAIISAENTPATMSGIGQLAPFNQYIPPVATKSFGQLQTPGDVLRAGYFTGLGMQAVPRVVKHDWARN